MPPDELVRERLGKIERKTGRGQSETVQEGERKKKRTTKPTEWGEDGQALEKKDLTCKNKTQIGRTPPREKKGREKGGGGGHTGKAKGGCNEAVGNVPL